MSRPRSRRQKGSGFIRRRKGHAPQLMWKRDGRQYSEVVSENFSAKELEDKLSDFIQRVKTGALAREREEKARNKLSPLYEAAVDSFVADQLSNDPLNSTRQTYTHVLKLAGRNGLDGLKIAEIKPFQVHDALRKIQRDHAASTTKLTHAALRRLFDYLREHEKIDAIAMSPLSKLRLPEAGVAAKVRDALSSEQIGALLLATASDRDLDLWTKVLIGTACRAGEALALQWSSVNWQHSRLTIAHSVSEGTIRGRGKIGPTKNRKSREVPIGPIAFRALETAFNDCADRYRQIGLSISSDDFIFPSDETDEGRKYPSTYAAFKGRFTRAAKRAGLKGTSPHVLRHSALTRAIAGDGKRPGISVHDAAAIAGHTNAVLITRVYGHAVGENLLRGAQLIDGLLPAPPSTQIVREGVRQVSEIGVQDR